MDIIDPIFNMHKVKFDILDKWNIVSKNQTTRAIVYINLENVFRLIMTPRINNFIQAAASVESEDYRKKFSLNLVSDIINLGQHYRLWLTKQNIDSRIILYWNYPIPEEYKNAVYLPTYRTTHNDRYRTGNMETSIILECLEEAYKFLSHCISYINEVYLINPLGLECSLVPLLLQKEVYNEDGVDTHHILVSNNPYEYSYVNYGFQIISPSVRKKEPVLVTKQNVIEVLKKKYSSSSVLTAPADLLEFINAVMGDSDRSIPKLSGVGIVAVIKMLETAIDQGYITSTTKDVHMLKSILKDEFEEIFERNYHCTSLEYQLKDVEPLEIHKIKSCLVDNYDDNALHAMNEEYFKLFPIEIIKPKTQQVLYEDVSPQKSIFANH